MNQQVQPTPPGAITSDTKDVVDAKMAEGEYVLPANVVRYIGIDKIQKMVAKATEEMAAMEAGGQVGGDPAPKPQVDSGDTRAFAEGGVVTKSSFDPTQYATVGSTLYGQPQQAPVTPEPKTETKNYVNAEGRILPVTFVDGKPTTAIPEGFFLQGTTQPVAQKSPVETSSEFDRSENAQGPTGAFGGRNPFEMTREELANSVSEMQSGLDMLGNIGRVGGGLAAMNPMLGAVAMLGMQVAKGSAISNLNRAALVAEARGDPAMAESIRGTVGKYTDGKLGNFYGDGTARFARDRDSFISGGGSITPYGQQDSVATPTISSSNRSTPAVRETGNEYDRSDPVSRTSEAATSTRQNSSTPGDFSSNKTSESRSFSRDTPSAPSRGESFSSVPGDFNASSGGLGFGDRDSKRGYSKGGLVKRKK